MNGRFCMSSLGIDIELIHVTITIIHDIFTGVSLYHTCYIQFQYEEAIFDWAGKVKWCRSHAGRTGRP